MRKKLIIKIILISFLLIPCMFFPISYARYNFNNTGSVNVDVAKWDIIINNETTNEELTFDLFESVNNTNIDQNIKAIAPGTNGSINFNIINNSDVVAEYTINIEEVENLNDIPILYSLEENGEYKELTDIVFANNEEISLGSYNTKEFTLYWKWEFYKDSNQNIKDNELSQTEAAKIIINTNIQVNQKVS